MRYHPDDFAPYDLQPTTNGSSKQSAPGQRQAPANIEEPTFEEIKALFAASKRAQRAWDRQLTTKDINDTSESGQDFALALVAAKLGWPEGKVGGLCLACRKSRGEDLKHTGYYDKTAQNALRLVAEEQQQAALAGRLDDFVRELEMRSDYAAMQTAPAAPSEAPEANPAASPGDAPSVNGSHGHSEGEVQPESDWRKPILEEILAQTGMDVVRMIRYVAHAGDEHEEPVYKIILKAGGVLLGPIDRWDSSHAFWRKIHYLAPKFPDMPMKQWRKLLRLLTLIAEDDDTSPESSDIGSCLSWLRHYLECVTVSDDREQALRERQPYATTKDAASCIAIFGDHFRAWLNRHHDQKITQKHLGNLFRRCGLQPSIENYTKVDKKHSTRLVWLVSSELMYQEGS